ncbi:MAG: DLW-39 family protein [Cellulomonadaceae bacterium]|nr:DLW-39 family protein [Cellulomonadaceae bacterium]
MTKQCKCSKRGHCSKGKRAHCQAGGNLAAILFIAAAAVAAWKKYNEAKAGRDLWTEVTDSVPD